jgi:hypothetical protein
MRGFLLAVPHFLLVLLGLFGEPFSLPLSLPASLFNIAQASDGRVGQWSSYKSAGDPMRLRASLGGVVSLDGGSRDGDCEARRGTVPRRYTAVASLHGEPGALVRRFRLSEAQERSSDRKPRCGLRESDQARRLSCVRHTRRRLPWSVLAPQERHELRSARANRRQVRRFAKIDMRVPLTAPANSRKAAARAAKIRAVFSRLRKETRQHRPKGAAKSAPKGGRSRCCRRVRGLASGLSLQLWRGKNK